MPKKMEVSKKFIEEFEKIKDAKSTLNDALSSPLYSHNHYDELHSFLFDNQLATNNENQIVLAKIWAGDIELVEDKSKYVIWSKGSKVDDHAEYMYRNVIRGHISTSPLRTFEAMNDECCHFDREFAFSLRDTEKFEIEKVE